MLPQLQQPGLAMEPFSGSVMLANDDVCFFNTSPGRLYLEITFHNAGPGPSEPTAALVGSAPLGAFVSWRPLATTRVPELEPGASFVFRDEVEYRVPPTLGLPDRVPPRALFTAIGAGDPRWQRPTLAPDLLGLVGQGGVHWAGNLNVFVGACEVERHLAQALRVYPGCLNMAMFVVGHGKPDGYRFRLAGDAAGWDARLIDGSFCPTLSAAAADGDELGPGEWHEMSHGMVFLAVEPPAAATAGSVAVHVRQRSTGKSAVVEFSLDSRAAGPGCYVV